MGGLPSELEIHSFQHLNPKLESRHELERHCFYRPTNELGWKLNP
jgi:hypothetical protein